MDTPRFRRLNQFPTGVLPLVKQAPSTIEQRQAEIEQSSQGRERPCRHDGLQRSIRLRLDAFDPPLQNLNADSRLPRNLAQERRLLAIALNQYDPVVRIGERQHEPRQSSARAQINDRLLARADERPKLQGIADMSCPQRAEALLADEVDLALPAREQIGVEPKPRL
jgi:hypothetical protein